MAEKKPARPAEKTVSKPVKKPNPEKAPAKKRGILPILRKRTKPEPETIRVPASPDTPALKFIFFIIDWKASMYISEIFEENHVRFHFICKGRGTASSEILDLLGIGASEKAIVLCLEQDVMVPILIREVNRGLGLYNPGAGIAFAIPLSAINKPILQVFKDSIRKHISDKTETKKEKWKKPDKEEKMNEKKFDLIVIVVNQGYSDELMALAKDAGATGGTIVNARGLVHKGPVKFFGIAVQDEKEIITIIADRDQKTAIMHAVSKAYGINTKAQGIVFSLPAENVTGLSQS
ncbi:MAG: hypothetical protein LBH35_04480 [Treponema sp.]|jgi:nitrogen regulatory protein PII-like uncharacterized protein|nr:hypothetical protein [Treponema sp.]